MKTRALRVAAAGVVPVSSPLVGSDLTCVGR